MKRLTAVLGALALSALVACNWNWNQNYKPDPVPKPSPSPSASPSPSPSPSASPVAIVACVEWHVFTSSFGWDGPAGQVRPPNQLQPYTLCDKCESVLTATLKTPQGDAPLSTSSGKGRPEWTVTPLGVVDITTEGTNNADGYNLKVTPVTGAGAAATVHVVLHALCVGDPPAADFKYVITAS